MQIPDVTLGYFEFPPERTKVIHAEEERKLTGSATIIKSEEVDLVWVRVTEAMSYLTFKGKIVKTFGHHNDFYGPLTSAKGLIEEAPALAAKWGIEKSSELELHVLAWVIDSPTLGYNRTEYGRKYYTPLGKTVWHDTPDAKVGEPFNFDNFPYESRNGVAATRHSASVVWKSSASDEENAAAFASYEALAKAADRVVTDTGIRIPE